MNKIISDCKKRFEELIQNPTKDNLNERNKLLFKIGFLMKKEKLKHQLRTEFNS